jgi:hypothetical protein
LPRISEFYGIVIAMFHNDHGRPHFHARYADHEAKVLIATGEIIVGSLPVRAARLVRVWTRLHRHELKVNWERSRAAQPLLPIEPLA